VVRVAKRILWMSLLLSGCAGTEDYALNDTIEMGPWSFRVQRASTRVESGGTNPFMRVVVSLSIEDFSGEVGQSFDDFLNGARPGSPFTNPRFRLVDDQGGSFEGLVIGKGSRWTAEFALIPSSVGIADASRAAEFLDREPGDFRLVINNPDRRSGQPARVSVQLE
jgi:hypothetical protein